MKPETIERRARERKAARRARALDLLRHAREKARTSEFWAEYLPEIEAANGWAERDGEAAP